MESIILASQSPRRKEILETLHLNFTAYSRNVSERVDKRLAPQDTVMEIGKKKIEAILPHLQDNADLVIASDTIVVHRDRLLGKPRSKEHGIQILEILSGDTHRVYSSVVLYDVKNRLWILDFDYTEVAFKELVRTEIESYLEKIQFKDKAGSYGIQDFGEDLVHSIQGDFFVVMGFPVERFKYRMKKHFSIDIDDKDLCTSYYDEIYRFTNRSRKIKDE